MAATRKRKPAATVSVPKVSAKASPKTPRKRARQIRNWLAFIRPHADRYEALPRGEQKRFIETLSKKSGSSEQTLRRYIAAARVLETHGIRELPPGTRYLPVASIEAIEHIGRRDPERGRELFANLLKGQAATNWLKAEVAQLLKRAKRPSRSGGVRTFSRMQIFELINRLADKDQHAPWPRPDWSALTLVSFEEASTGRTANLFARSAAPRFVVAIAAGKRAVVFDESVLAWTGGPALITREFLRNIAVAVAMFDYAVIVCDMLMDQVEGVVAQMPEGCRDRIAVRRGRLDLKS